jgi:hypothetical protein
MTQSTLFSDSRWRKLSEPTLPGRGSIDGEAQSRIGALTRERKKDPAADLRPIERLDTDQSRLAACTAEASSLGENEVLFAVDQPARRVKATTVDDGLCNDVKHDFSDGVEPPGAEEVWPPRRWCIEREGGDD